MEIHFLYDGTDYIFDAPKCITDKAASKEIYIGRFPGTINGNAPGDAVLDTDYCLKRIHVKKTESPSGRDYWDLIPFEGENLKRILVADDKTAEIVERIKNGTAVEELIECQIIEPVYSVIHPRDFSDYNKLELLLQTERGLVQLQENHIGSRLAGIMAHRDMKLQNIMIEWNGKEFTVKIIDFASLKFIKGSTAGTRTGAMSLSNTTPEHVLGYYPYNGTNDERTDVFALGMMLAEIFDIVKHEGKLKSVPLNPLIEWFVSQPGDNNTDEKYVRLYEGVIEKGSDADAGCTSWLEKELYGNGFSFNFPRGEFGDELKRLFYDSTRLVSGDRISLDEFAKRLVRLQEMLPVSNDEYSIFLFDANGYDDHLTEYLTSATRVFLSNRHSGMRVEMFAYGNAPEATVSPQYINDVVKHMVARDKDKRPIELRSITTIGRVLELYRKNAKELASGTYKVNGLSVALYKVCEYVKNNKGFNGRIYIFSHNLPAKEKMCSVVDSGEHICSFDRIVKMVSEHGQIVSYSHNMEKSSDEWCVSRELCRLDGTPSESAGDDTSEDDDVPEKATPEKKNVFADSVFIRMWGEPVIVSKKRRSKK